MYAQGRPEGDSNPNSTLQERVTALRALRGHDGPPGRSTNEEFWAAMLPQLISQGYTLRPRYQEGWKPTWKSLLETIGDVIEDAIPADCSAAFIDAERIRDNMTVAFKITVPSHAEAEIASYLSSEPLRSDPRNHCVPILDVLTINDGKFDWTVLVMPLLRTFDDPDFETVGDCVSFVHQLLEGICFIHDHGVAHRDCTGSNIMMDATPLFPNGWHPQSPGRSRDAKRTAQAKSRRSLTAPIQYYYADWGISSRHPLDDPKPQVVGVRGQDKRPPELSDEIPYDPFKLDIHILGGLFSDSILMKTSSLDFLSPLVQAMTRDIPRERPSAPEALQLFEEASSKMTPRQLRSRLRPRSEEDALTGILLDSTHTVREALYTTWKLLGFHS